MIAACSCKLGQGSIRGLVLIQDLLQNLANLGKTENDRPIAKTPIRSDLIVLDLLH